MYIIYSDESDKHGAYFSNFYGGIIINSAHIAEFTNRISAAIKECGIDEEIKWQKVNVYTRQKYELIIDELFSLLDEGKARIRIFFTQNRNRPVGLTEEQRKNSYTILYYQFLKHAFGLKYAPCGEDNRIQILIDEMPIPDSQRKDFKKYLYALNESKPFCDNGISIQPNIGIAEVNSKKHIPLQVLDLVLGAICFRLNNKHKLKDPITGRRGKRTVEREKLYKHIFSHICKTTCRQFNIGVSTGVNKPSDTWFAPYLHWLFVPNHSEIDNSFDKGKQI